MDSLDESNRRFLFFLERPKDGTLLLLLLLLLLLGRHCERHLCHRVTEAVPHKAGRSSFVRGPGGATRTPALVSPATGRWRFFFYYYYFVCVMEKKFLGFSLRTAGFFLIFSVAVSTSSHFFLLYPIFNLFNFFVNYSQIGPSVFSNDFFFGCLKSKRTRLIQNLKKWKLSLKLKAKTFQKKFASQFNVVSFLWNSSTDLILSIPFFCLNQV